MATLADLVVKISGDTAQLTAALGRAEKSTNTFSGKLGGIKKIALGAAAGLVGVQVATNALRAGISGSIGAAISFESTFAGIRKTMELTEKEFGRLAQANRDMAKEIPVTADEINRIGELAGQLGIRGVDNVVKFERTIADLANTTDLTADDAALSFAQIANVIQLPQDQIDRLGSAVVDLGNQFATTESRIVDFTTRIAGAGKIAGLSAADVAGIATAFTSVGVEAQMGGTAVQKVLIAMNQAVISGSEELGTFAKVLGVSTDEFGRMVEQAPAETFVQFVEALGRSGKDAIAILGDLGLEDQRLIRAFLGVAGAGDTMRRAVEVSNTAFSENTALQTEAEKRYETTAAQLAILRNNLVDAGIGMTSALLPAIRTVSQALSKIAQTVGDHQAIFQGLAFVVGTTLVAAFAAWAASAVVAAIAANAALLGIPAAIALIVAGIYLLVRHWEQVWGSLQAAPQAVLDWVKQHWQDVLLFLAGPAGALAVLIRNWDEVWGRLPAPAKQALDRVGDAVETVANGIIRAFEFAVNEAIKALNWLGSKAGGLVGKLTGGKVELDLGISPLSLGRVGQVMEAGWLGSSAEKARKTLFDVEHGIKKVADEAAGAVPDLEDYNSEIAAGGAGAASAADKMSDLQKGLLDLVAAANASGLSQDDFARFLDAAALAMDKYALTAEELRRVIDMSSLSLMEFADRIMRLDALDDLTQKTKTATDAVNELYSAFNNAFARPTREEAGLNLQLAQLRQERAERTARFGIGVNTKKFDEQIDAIQREIDVRQAQHDVDRALLDLANQTLMSDAQQKVAVDMITTAMGSASSQAQTLADTLFWTILALASWRDDMQRWVNAVTSNVPSIPSYGNGGIVPGAIGEPRLIRAHGGEEIVKAGARSGGLTNYGHMTVQVVGGSGEDVLRQLERRFR